ncbi:hypothetical protein BCR34DRAFT_198939 [Clohesyomyces aquaticus]|uniref:Uncharacterized protein n=1 Tax=Clohesyomyces aquaticus TaxID=1231657 RepID=A0A1Y1ZZ81_9PLEO|nr:hypothetical protein BCR34DRAFT_198939 [Clohesyomyces aquaticus]
MLVLATGIDGPLPIAFAQELFSGFCKALFALDTRTPQLVARNWNLSDRFRKASWSQIIKTFGKYGLGSQDGSVACIVPAIMAPRGETLEKASMNFAVEKSYEHVDSGNFEEAVEHWKWALDMTFMDGSRLYRSIFYRIGHFYRAAFEHSTSTSLGWKGREHIIDWAIGGTCELIYSCLVSPNRFDHEIRGFTTRLARILLPICKEYIQAQE